MMNVCNGELLIAQCNTYHDEIGWIESGDLVMIIDAHADKNYALIMTRSCVANASKSWLTAKIKMKDFVFHRVENE